MALSKHVGVTHTRNIYMFDDKSRWRWRYHTTDTRQEAILLVYNYKLWWPDFGISFTSPLVFKMNYDFIEYLRFACSCKYRSCNCKRFLVGFICSNGIFRNISTPINRPLQTPFRIAAKMIAITFLQILNLVNCFRFFQSHFSESFLQCFFLTCNLPYTPKMVGKCRDSSSISCYDADRLFCLLVDQENTFRSHVSNPHPHRTAVLSIPNDVIMDGH